MERENNIWHYDTKLMKMSKLLLSVALPVPQTAKQVVLEAVGGVGVAALHVLLTQLT